MAEMRTARGRTGVPLIGLVGFLAFCARASDAPPAPPPSDHAVYSTVIREHFIREARGGEHGIHCELEEPGRGLTIVGTTQALPPGTPARDSGWAAELPAPAAPLMATLRTLDRQPARALDADSLALGVPVHLVPDSIAARALRPIDRPAARTGPSTPALFWVSRVAYSADGDWALVYAVEVCPGVTEADAAEAETGAYESVLLAPLQWRAGAWTVHPPLYLDVGLPRLERD